MLLYILKAYHDSQILADISAKPCGTAIILDLGMAECREEIKAAKGEINRVV